jgi:glucosamine--fructose-6-phosphate aminotransferase (isomerizing)
MDQKDGNYTHNEIVTQGGAWQATLEAASLQTEDFLKWIQKPHAQAIFTGCGSTFYLSLTAASIWQTLTGMHSYALPASELWLYLDPALIAPSSLLVAISRSGETTETLKAVERYQAQVKGDSLAITCYADSGLTQLVDQVQLTRQADEKSVAQTRSFTSMLVLNQVLAGLVSRNFNYLESLQSLPAACNQLLRKYDGLARELGNDPEIEHFVFLGSGMNFGLANEAMLKMKEMSLSSSQAFHFLEFRHGPKSVVTPNTLIVGLLNDLALEQEIKVLQEMQALGAKVLALTETDIRAGFDYTIELCSKVPNLSRAPLFLPILQLLAFYRARKKGLNPDLPKNLDTVVKL